LWSARINPFLAGLTTLTATDSDVSLPALTAASSTFTVTAAAASQTADGAARRNTGPGNLSLGRGVTGSPSTELAGAAFSVTVNITDAFWNPVTTASGTVHLVSSDPNNVSSGPGPRMLKIPSSSKSRRDRPSFPIT